MSRPITAKTLLDIENIIRGLVKAGTLTHARGQAIVRGRKSFEAFLLGKSFNKGGQISLPKGIDSEEAVRLLDALQNGTLEQYTQAKILLDEQFRFYRDVFTEISEDDLKKQFSEIIIPERSEEQMDLWSLQVILRGFTAEGLFAKCRERFNGKAWKYYNNIDQAIVECPRNTTNPYAIWHRGGQEADEENGAYDGQGIIDAGLEHFMTPIERIVFGLWYHWRTGGGHLDLRTGTITSARDSDGGVVVVDWNDINDRLRFSSMDPRGGGTDWRPRSVVS